MRRGKGSTVTPSRSSIAKNACRGEKSARNDERREIKRLLPFR